MDRLEGSGHTEERVARQIQLAWGVRSLLIEREVSELSEVVPTIDRQLLAALPAKVASW